MDALVATVDAAFEALPLPLLVAWGRLAFLLGILVALCAYGRLTLRDGDGWAPGIERQTWDAKAVLAIPVTCLAIVLAGTLGSFIVLVPGAQTFESLKDLAVFLAILLFGWPALVTVPFAYGLSDLIEGVPPGCLVDWLPGYFINPACFWLAYQLIGRDPDFRARRTWGRYFAFVAAFMLLEPPLWGHICARTFTAQISYRSVTPALVFTTSITWLMAPFAMLIALPLARRAGMFWAEIPAHVRVRRLGSAAWRWVAGGAADEAPQLPIRMVILVPFIALVLVMVGATAFVTLQCAEDDGTRLAAQLHQETSANIVLALEDFLERSPPDPRALRELLHGVARHGIAAIVDREGRILASSAEGDVLAAAVSRLAGLPRAELREGVPFTFDHVTAKPVARTTWLARARAFRPPHGDGDWVVLTLMPESYYLAGVRVGHSRAAMMFALALLLSVAAGAFLAARVTDRLREISLATEALARGELAQRVPGSRMQELDTLARGFNRMAEQLSGSFDDLRASQERLQVEARVLGLVASGAPLGDVLDATVRAIESLAPGTIGSVLLLEDGVHLRDGAGPSLPLAFRRAVDGLAIGPARGSCGTAMYRRELVVVEDIETDPLWKDFRGLALEHGLRACWSAPIVDASGTVLGSFALYYREPRAPRGEDLALIRRASHLAGVAIENRRAAQRNRELAEALQQRVRELTCLQSAGRLLHDNRLATVEWLEGLAGMLPSGFQFPQDTAARVSLGSLSSARALPGTPWRLRAVSGDGCVEVAYLTAHPARAEGPFLAEERSLIDSVAELLRAAVDRRQAEERLRQSQKMEALGQLAAGVAHDFNNLLTVISGYAEMELSVTTAGDPHLASLRAIAAAGVRAESLTRQLLAFSRQTVLQPRVLNVNAAIEETAMMLRRLIGADVELRLELDPAAHPVRFDPGQLGQVLINLCVNARDAMPDGGTLTIATRNVDRCGPHTQLSVSDTGHGMPPEVRARIFEPFFTTKPSGQGSGLGLAMVHGIVSQSGGRVEVDSAVARGTTFRIFLPAAGDADARVADAGAQPLRSGTETVLVAEDDAAVRRLATLALEAHGYRVLVAVDGEDALAVAGAHRGALDLLVADVVMPRLGGRELAEQLRARLPGLRVLYVSGYSSEAVLRDGLLSDGVELLQKPYTALALARKAREMLDRRG